MESLNVVALTGTLARDPTIRVDGENASPRCSATPRQVRRWGSTEQIPSLQHRRIYAHDETS